MKKPAFVNRTNSRAYRYCSDKKSSSLSFTLFLLVQLILISLNMSVAATRTFFVQAKHSQPSFATGRRLAAFSTFPGRGTKNGRHRTELITRRERYFAPDFVSMHRSAFSTKSRFSTSTRSVKGKTNENAEKDTAPKYIDEDIADHASYAIPAFKKGDDMLTDIPKGTRILSFGDVHGDILALYKFLQAAQILDPKSTITNPIWNGGDTILVQCGDILDRGAEELFCLRYLSSLARQAPAQGGRVILLHGNHEALNANGLFQYADPKGNEEIEVVLGKKMDNNKSEGTPRWRIQYAGNQASRWAAFEPNGWLAEALYSNMSVAAVVGKTVFVHAGLTKDHISKFGGIEMMNTEAREWFVSDYPDELKNDDGYKFQTVQEVIDNANLRAKTASKTMPGCLGGGIGAASPVWMREYSSPADAVPKAPMAQKMIDDCLGSIGHGVQRMVMGHTPQSQINAALKGKAWRIDVGASKGVMNGAPEVLEIIHEGGENGEDIINILTVDGDRIPGSERQSIEFPF